MERYFVEVDKKSTPEKSTREAVEEAFDSSRPLSVQGTRETVPVNMDLEISMYKRAREGRQVLIFSGVVLPEERPFIGEFDETDAEPIQISLVVEPDSATS